MSNVLIVDDEQDVCDAVCRVLSRAGHQASAATDAETGFDACVHDNFDIVITDIIMPGENGIEFIRRLRDKFPDLGIIAISGGGNAALAGYQPEAIKTAAYIAAAEQAGADRCLTKPFESAELLNSVAQLGR